MIELELTDIQITVRSTSRSLPTSRADTCLFVFTDILLPLARRWKAILATILGYTLSRGQEVAGGTLLVSPSRVPVSDAMSYMGFHT